MRRRIRVRSEGDRSLPTLQFWHDDRFLWAAVIFLIVSLIFGSATTYWVNQGRAETTAMWYGLFVAGAAVFPLQLANLWRGYLLTMVFKRLRVLGTSNTNSKPEAAPQSDVEELLKGINCSCKRKEQAVGVCHHCGRFVCKKCGDLRPDKRFTIPGKSIYEREEAWHCSRCLSDYHANEWPRIPLFKS